MTTGVGRSHDRTILRMLLAGGGLQITIVAVGLVTLPFVTRSLSTPQYGCFVTLSSVVVLASLADAGIGSALGNRLAGALAVDDEAGLRNSMASALLSVACLSAGIAVVGVAVVLASPMDFLSARFQVGESEMRNALLITALAAGASPLASLGQRMLYGVHRGRLATLWLAGSAIFSGVACVGVSIVGAPLWAFILATSCITVVTGMACTWWVAFRSKWLPRPRFSDVRLHDVRGLISSGKWFFLIAMFSGIGYQTDPIVATSVLGASAAAVLAVSNRVFSMLTQCIYPALLQLWPAFTDSLVRGEIAWIRSRLLLASLLAGGLGAAGGVALVVSGPWLIANWLTEDLAPTSGLLGVTAVWTAYSLATAPMMLFLNAVGSVREHALMAIAVGTVNLPLSIILAEHVGIEGPIIANLVSNVCCLGIPGAFIVLRVLRRIDADATAS